MRFALFIWLAVFCTAGLHAAPPTKSPMATSLDISIRTAADLADACTVSPTSKANFARLNFCNGFAQGILQTNGQTPRGAKICMPSPSPKRSETMKEFATWVKADAARNGQEVSTTFLNFMSSRLPCKETPEKPKP